MRRSARPSSSETPAAALFAMGLLALGMGASVFLVRSGGKGHGFERYSGTTVEGATFPKRLRNGDDVTTLARPPTRLASLIVPADELLTELVPPARLIAVSRFADDANVAMSAGRVPPGVARIRGADPERILELSPELVFVTRFNLDSGMRILSGAGVSVVRLADATSYDDVAANVRLVADVVGESSRGEALLRTMKSRLDAVRAKVAGLAAPRVLYYSAVDYTAGKDTLIDEKIRRAGGVNVAAELGLVGFHDVALDVLIGLNPDIIVVPAWSGDHDAPVRELLNDATWRGVAAVERHRVFAVRAAALTSETPDGVLGVEELARLFHPEAFAA
jgi:iron complex transport system substrate-binding protein